MIDTGLTGKVVLITGANNPYGIGANAARAFAAQGAAVFLHYFRRSVPLSDSTSQEMGESFYWATQKHSADELVTEIEATGGRAAAWEADLSDPAIVPQIFDRAEAALGPVEEIGRASCRERV